MDPPHGAEMMILKSLTAEGDPIDAEAAELLQIAAGNRFRIGLHGDLHGIGKTEEIPKPFEQELDLTDRQQRGRAAAEIDRQQTVFGFLIFIESGFFQ